MEIAHLLQASIDHVKAQKTNSLYILDQLIALGKITGYEIERRETGACWVSVRWLEFDEDSPGGVSNCGNGCGKTVSEALQHALMQMPRESK